MAVRGPVASSMMANGFADEPPLEEEDDLSAMLGQLFQMENMTEEEAQERLDSVAYDPIDLAGLEEMARKEYEEDLAAGRDPIYTKPPPRMDQMDQSGDSRDQPGPSSSHSTSNGVAVDQPTVNGKTKEASEKRQREEEEVKRREKEKKKEEERQRQLEEEVRLRKEESDRKKKEEEEMEERVREEMKIREREKKKEEERQKREEEEVRRRKEEEKRQKELAFREEYRQTAAEIDEEAEEEESQRQEREERHREERNRSSSAMSGNSNDTVDKFTLAQRARREREKKEKEQKAMAMRADIVDPEKELKKQQAKEKREAQKAKEAQKREEEKKKQREEEERKLEQRRYSSTSSSSDHPVDENDGIDTAVREAEMREEEERNRQLRKENARKRAEKEAAKKERQERERQEGRSAENSDAGSRQRASSADSATSDVSEKPKKKRGRPPKNRQSEHDRAQAESVKRKKKTIETSQSEPEDEDNDEGPCSSSTPVTVSRRNSVDSSRTLSSSPLPSPTPYSSSTSTRPSEEPTRPVGVRAGGPKGALPPPPSANGEETRKERRVEADYVGRNAHVSVMKMGRIPKKKKENPVPQPSSAVPRFNQPTPVPHSTPSQPSTSINATRPPSFNRPTAVTGVPMQPMSAAAAAAARMRMQQQSPAAAPITQQAGRRESGGSTDRRSTVKVPPQRSKVDGLLAHMDNCNAPSPMSSSSEGGQPPPHKRPAVEGTMRLGASGHSPSGWPSSAAGRSPLVGSPASSLNSSPLSTGSPMSIDGVRPSTSTSIRPLPSPSAAAAGPSLPPTEAERAEIRRRREEELMLFTRPVCTPPLPTAKTPRDSIAATLAQRQAAAAARAEDAAVSVVPCPPASPGDDLVSSEDDEPPAVTAPVVPQPPAPVVAPVPVAAPAAPPPSAPRRNFFPDLSGRSFSIASSSDHAAGRTSTVPSAVSSSSALMDPRSKAPAGPARDPRQERKRQQQQPPQSDMRAAGHSTVQQQQQPPAAPAAAPSSSAAAAAPRASRPTIVAGDPRGYMSRGEEPPVPASWKRIKDSVCEWEEERSERDAQRTRDADKYKLIPIDGLKWSKRRRIAAFRQQNCYGPLGPDDPPDTHRMPLRGEDAHFILTKDGRKPKEVGCSRWGCDDDRRKKETLDLWKDFLIPLEPATRYGSEEGYALEQHRDAPPPASPIHESSDDDIQIIEVSPQGNQAAKPVQQNDNQQEHNDDTVESSTSDDVETPSERSQPGAAAAVSLPMIHVPPHHSMDLFHYEDTIGCPERPEETPEQIRAREELVRKMHADIPNRITVKRLQADIFSMLRERVPQEEEATEDAEDTAAAAPAAPTPAASVAAPAAVPPPQVSPISSSSDSSDGLPSGSSLPVNGDSAATSTADERRAEKESAAAKKKKQEEKLARMRGTIAEIQADKEKSSSSRHHSSSKGASSSDSRMRTSSSSSSRFSSESHKQRSREPVAPPTIIVPSHIATGSPRPSIVPRVSSSMHSPSPSVLRPTSTSGRSPRGNSPRPTSRSSNEENRPTSSLTRPTALLDTAAAAALKGQPLSSVVRSAVDEEGTFQRNLVDIFGNKTAQASPAASSAVSPSVQYNIVYPHQHVQPVPPPHPSFGPFVSQFAPLPSYPTPVPPPTSYFWQPPVITPVAVPPPPAPYAPIPPPPVALIPPPPASISVNGTGMETSERREEGPPVKRRREEEKEESEQPSTSYGGGRREETLPNIQKTIIPYYWRAPPSAVVDDDEEDTKDGPGLVPQIEPFDRLDSWPELTYEEGSRSIVVLHFNEDDSIESIRQFLESLAPIEELAIKNLHEGAPSLAVFVRFRRHRDARRIVAGEANIQNYKFEDRTMIVMSYFERKIITRFGR